MTKNSEDYLYEKFKELFVKFNRKPPIRTKFALQKNSFKNVVSLIKEQEIFRSLFSLQSNNVLYHYTSFDTLLHIINSQKLKFSGVTGFNDANELRSKSTIIGNGIKNPFNKKRMDIINKRFVFSLSKRKDDLNQWRLYGNDGKGICLGFKLDLSKYTDSTIYAGEIHYENTVRDFLIELIEYTKQEWPIPFDINHSSKWGYFLKGYEWKDEQEVMVFIVKPSNYQITDINQWSTNSYGILYPSIFVDLKDSSLELSSIILGPKCPSPELNKTQISTVLKTCHKPWSSIPITISNITSYR